MTTPAASDAQEREIVVRIRRRRRRPEWSLGRVAGWSGLAVAGDPVLLLVPALMLVALLIAVLGLGAPARAEVVVPLVVAPPADSYQDVGILALAGVDGAARWVGRAGFALARTAAFAVLVALALARARGEAPSLAAARRAVGRRPGSLLGLGAASFGYALLVSQQQSLDPARDAGVAATALAAGTLILPGAFVAALAARLGALKALARGVAVRRWPGHLVLVVAYGAAVGGLARLAAFGEPAGPRALPLVLYALASALVTTAFVCALARRFVLLHEPAAGPPEQAESRALSPPGGSASL